MVSAAHSYQRRASTNLKNSGIFLLIAGSVSFILNILSLWIYFGWFGWFREILSIIALILLIVAIGSLKLLLPQNNDEIEICRRWIIIWVVLNFVWSFGYLIHPFVSVSLLVLAVIARIFALAKLNIVFQVLSDTYPNQGRFDSWIYLAYGFFGIAIIIPNIFAALDIAGYFSVPIVVAIVLGLVIRSINFLLLLGVGIMLIQNSQKLLRITLKAIPGVPYAPQIHYDSDSRSGPIQESEPIRRFCENCGAKIKIDEKFCQNCGYELVQT